MKAANKSLASAAEWKKAQGIFKERPEWRAVDVMGPGRRSIRIWRNRRVTHL